MTIPAFWKPMIASLVLTPVALFLAVVSGGAGHGDYLWARILFPYTMLSTLRVGSITGPFIWLAIVQFPVYGVALGVANKNHKILPAAFLLLAIHSVAAIIASVFLSENFR